MDGLEDTAKAQDELAYAAGGEYGLGPSKDIGEKTE